MPVWSKFPLLYKCMTNFLLRGLKSNAILILKHFIRGSFLCVWPNSISNIPCSISTPATHFVFFFFPTGSSSAQLERLSIWVFCSYFSSGCVLRGRSLSVTFPNTKFSLGIAFPKWCKKSLSTVPFEALLHSPGEFVVVRHTLSACLPRCCLFSAPFQRASINRSPDTFKIRQNVSSRNHLTSAGKAVVKHRFIDWMIISGVLWVQLLSTTNQSGVTVRGLRSPAAKRPASDTDVKHMFSPTAQQK